MGFALASIQLNKEYLPEVYELFHTDQTNSSESVAL